MAKLQRIFTPVKIGGLELKNRLIMAPLGTRLAGPDGEVTDRLVDYLVERARGGVSLIIAEISCVHVSGRRPRGVLVIDHDKYIPGMRRLAHEVHQAGAKIAVQLWHPGRAMKGTFLGTPPVGPSAIPSPFHKTMPRELTIAEIKELVEAYGEAARRCREAGMDAVEVHGAHGYLCCQFLSRSCNKRTDQYGGSIENRARFPCEVIASVKSKAGQDFPTIYRFSAEEDMPEGLTLNETMAAAPLFVRAGADALHVSIGSQESWWQVAVSMDEKAGALVPLAAAIKGVVKVPVIAVGRISDPRLAEKVLAEGHADIIALGRPLLADPMYPMKAAAGAFSDIRKCIACNVGCMSQIMVRGAISCIYNPEVAREREMKIVPAARPKKVMVVGGGPGGLEAARVAALRGHQVTLYEQSETLGGQVRLLAQVPKRGEYSNIYRWLGAQAHKAGVDIRLGRKVTPALVKREAPDAVVVATGAVPLTPAIPGARGRQVVTPQSILTGETKVGDRVVILGGTLMGLDTADFISGKAGQTTVVEVLEAKARKPSPGSSPYTFLENRLAMTGGLPDFWAAHYLFRRLAEHGVDIRFATEVKDIRQGRIKIAYDGNEETLGPFDTVVLALGRLPNNKLAEAIRGMVNELYVIGDAVKPRGIMQAVHEGSEVARKI